MINGISWLVVTKLDVLDHLTEIPVCVGYKVDGKETDEVPAQACGYEKIECIYRNMPGWATPTQAIRTVESICRKQPANIWPSSKKKLGRGSA